MENLKKQGPLAMALHFHTTYHVVILVIEGFIRQALHAGPFKAKFTHNYSYIATRYS